VDDLIIKGDVHVIRNNQPHTWYFLRLAIRRCRRRTRCG
jgi:hypothetical protein